MRIERSHESSECAAPAGGLADGLVDPRRGTPHLIRCGFLHRTRGVKGGASKSSQRDHVPLHVIREILGILRIRCRGVRECERQP